MASRYRICSWQRPTEDYSEWYVKHHGVFLIADTPNMRKENLWGRNHHTYYLRSPLSFIGDKASGLTLHHLATHLCAASLTFRQ
jgi:hypothetical protein